MTDEPCPLCGRPVHADEPHEPFYHEPTGIWMEAHSACLPDDSSLR